MDKNQFKGIFPALLTPFDKNNKVNGKELEKLIKYNVDKGATGFYVGGSTAEAFLLSTDERCIQFATGYGLEGVLPDAICKRIQSQYMVKHFGKDDWNQGMIEGIKAVAAVLDGSMEALPEEENDEIVLIQEEVELWVQNIEE